MSDFLKELEELLNQHTKETKSDSPEPPSLVWQSAHRGLKKKRGRRTLRTFLDV